MKKSKVLKEYEKERDSILIESYQELDMKLQKINKKFVKELELEISLDILERLCEGEKLNFDKMKKKYLNIKNTETCTDTSSESSILDKIEIDGKEYFYETKEKGKVYNMESKQVGVYKSGKFEFN